jgi:hypothetical protein
VSNEIEAVYAYKCQIDVLSAKLNSLRKVAENAARTAQEWSGKYLELRAALEEIERTYAQGIGTEALRISIASRALAKDDGSTAASG